MLDVLGVLFTPEGLSTDVDVTDPAADADADATSLILESIRVGEVRNGPRDTVVSQENRACVMHAEYDTCNARGRTIEEKSRRPTTSQPTAKGLLRHGHSQDSSLIRFFIDPNRSAIFLDQQ